jgi:hypothetical protein
VFLKVKERCSSLKLGNCSKLVVHYCGPFEILERIGLVAYMLAFPASLCIHNVFHVSLLKEPEGDFRVRPVFILDQESQAALESSHGVGKGPMDMVRS